MQWIKVGAAVLNQTPMAWESNTKHILDAIRVARTEGVSILCMPELCITGYGCEDAFHSPGLQRTALEILQEIVPHTRDMIVSLGLPLQHGGALFNAVCLVVNSQIAGFVAKQHLAGEGIHYEPRWFKPWPDNACAEITLGEDRYPMGDLVFDCGGVRLGFEICEDAWTATRPGKDLAAQGVDFILNPSASHFAFGKHAIRRRLVLEGSRTFFVSYLYANLLGNEAGRAIYDGDAMIASSGEMLATGPRFSFADHHLVTAAVDVDATRMLRSRSGTFQPRVGGTDEEIVKMYFAFPEIESTMIRNTPANWEAGAWLKEEEFCRAIALGLFDYMRKSRSHGFVLSLSGGADSSATATLIAMMVQEGVRELGVGGFLEKISYMELPRLSSANEIVGSVLTTVYQSTRNSSETTRRAAGCVAEGLNARHMELDVDPIVQNYLAVVSGALERELTWTHDDIALQNIQARSRSPSVWMLANIQRALLVSTSNRSEAAVGYATMDGDTSGGLSPIAGIDKAFLRHWLHWMEDHGLENLGPVTALAAVNEQVPTAELRPLTAGQTDEDDLMPYDVLDTIERAAIRDKLTPIEVFRSLSVQQTEADPRQLADWIERFFRLWCRNQWKRERYAPSFHLDDENLDPKTWCRFPILSGGFDRELGELWTYVDRL